MLVPAVEHQSFLPHPTPADAPDLGIERQPWMADANCHGQTKLFFPEGKGLASHKAYEAAKLICASCPVADACLAYALENGTGQADWGCWAGTLPRDRRKLRRDARRTQAA